MQRSRIYEKGVGFRDGAGLAELPELVKKPNTVVWTIFHDPSQQDIDRVQATLGLHPLATEDLLENEDRPRIRVYGQGASVVFFAVEKRAAPGEELAFHPFHLFVGHDSLLTVFRGTLHEVDEALAHWEKSADYLSCSAEAPLYALLDTVVDHYFPVVDAIGDEVDEIEDEVLASNGHGTLDRIFTLKKDLLRLRRVLGSGRDVLNGLLRYDETTPESDALYLRDIYDNLSRLVDQVDTYRDLLGNALDASLAVTSNELAKGSNALNITMKTLTAWSIILGSGTFIAGLYGMNVKGLPGAERDAAFAFVAGFTLLVALVLVAVFRRLGWF